MKAQLGTARNMQQAVRTRWCELTVEMVFVAAIRLHVALSEDRTYHPVVESQLP